MIDREHSLPNLHRQPPRRSASAGPHPCTQPPTQPSVDGFADHAPPFDELHLDYPFAGSPDAAPTSLNDGRASRSARPRAASLMEAHRDRGYLSPCRTPANPAPGHKDLPVVCCAAQSAVRTPPSASVGDGHHLPSDGARLRLFVRRGQLVQPPRPLLACRSPWRPTSASRPSRRRWPGTASRRSSTPTRAASSRRVDFTSVLLKTAIAISMDGKGAWRDNIFVERLWRTVKYEEVYLKAYDGVGAARSSIGRYLALRCASPTASELDTAARRDGQACFAPSPPSRRRHRIFQPRAGRVFESGCALPPSHAPDARKSQRTNPGGGPLRRALRGILFRRSGPALWGPTGG